MKLINDQLFIDLSPYLDMTSFDLLEDQISYNIAKNAKNIEPSYTPHSTLLNKELPGYLEERETYKKTYPEFGPAEVNWYTKLKGTSTLGTHLLLRGNKGYPSTYKYKHLNEHSVNMASYGDFGFLFKWIEDQGCFDEYGRTMFWINEPNQITAMHTDYGNPNLDKRDPFIWLTGRYAKKILLHDDSSTIIHESNSRAMIFNTVNWHCSKGHSDFISWSLRVDGKFNAEWADRVGIREYYGL